MFTLCLIFLFSCNGYHLVLHVLTHSCPTRRSSDLPARSIWCEQPGDHQHDDAGEHRAEARRFPQPSEISERQARSEEHTSELQSLMRTSYAVFCLQKKKHKSAR